MARRRGGISSAVLLSALLASPGLGLADPPPAGQSRIEAALANIASLERPHQDGLATIWDGNKYVQCRRMPDRALHCEAAGALMQPSLARILVPDRVARLAALGWSLDPSFGNYAQTFPADAPASQVAAKILQTLSEGYEADLANIQIQSDWIANEPCPPRNGPTQNLAGMINDAPALARTAIHACAYTPTPVVAIGSAAELINVYGARVTGEIQRLRVNIDRNIFVVFQTDICFVQCAPETSPSSIYCEAQSPDSWPALASVLTPERLARLHAAGFADPGRAPNYWKLYPLEKFDDAAIAHELLTVLYDVYGYNGASKLVVKTEKEL
jgi:type III secretion system-like peptide-binding chaperone